MIDMYQIEGWREKGRSFAWIGNRLGLDPKNVQYLCYEHGVVGPNDFTRQSKTYSPEMDEKLIQWRIEGVSLCEIGRRIGKGHSAVRSRLRTLARHEMMEEAA